MKNPKHMKFKINCRKSEQSEYQQNWSDKHVTLMLLTHFQQAQRVTTHIVRKSGTKNIKVS